MDGKLSDADVCAIWDRWLTTEENYRQIGEIYGVTDMAVWKIINGVTHIHLAPPLKDPFPRARARQKLAPTQVREIKQRLVRGNESKAAIARAYGVSSPTIRRIANGERWKDVS
jgi:hypothetical protein